MISPPESFPHILCVDEFKGDTGIRDTETKRWITNEYQYNITDDGNKVLIDVLPIITKEHLVTYFMGYSKQERSRVDYFCCDMHSGFIGVAKQCFPNAVICIDSFHVVNRLNEAMDDIRRRIQSKLDESETKDSSKSAKYLKDSAYILKTKEANKQEYWGTQFAKSQERLDRILHVFCIIRQLEEFGARDTFKSVHRDASREKNLVLNLNRLKAGTSTSGLEMHPFDPGELYLLYSTLPYFHDIMGLV